MVQRTGTAYFADPHRKQPGEINHNHGGRGMYFLDPAGHGMEIITRPYADHAPQQQPPPNSVTLIGPGDDPAPAVR